MEELPIQSAADVLGMTATRALPAAGRSAEAARSPAALVMVMRLLQEAGHALGSDQNEAQACLQKAAALLRATPKPKAGHSPGVARCRLAAWQVVRVHAFIQTNLAQKIAIEDLAAVARLSPSHFSRAFRCTVGLAPHAYVIRRRIEQARKLIRDTDKPLSEIALDCGLADQAHLTKLFRRFVGLSPGAWRRRYGAEGKATKSDEVVADEAFSRVRARAPRLRALPFAAQETPNARRIEPF
jgi:AraC family transcriptional regulator